MPHDTPRLLRFGRFQISPAERVLRVDGVPAALGPRAFDLLLALAERRERLVGKQELLDLVWPGVVVEEHNITAQVSSLRKLLGPNVIATIPGRGYQFVATPDAPAAEEPRSGEPPSRHNLPEQRTRFIGRTAALAELEPLLARSRLLTLTGIGGCGKTRLALEFARRRLADFPDGAWFVDLAPLQESGRVAAACAAAVDPGVDPDAASLERLAARLAERQALVVLDNCEHVRAGAAALADALLARPGRARILATSREPLAVAGEQLYPVRSLSLPATMDLDEVRAADAVSVFVDRARLVVPEFDVDAANAAPLVEICRRLDGIALAIELAAARVAMLSVGDIAARLEDRFRLLTGGRSPEPRHQALLATLQWSHDLLAPAEQRMLRQLAVFAGGCTLDATRAVAQVADEYEALMLLTTLHDKSLLAVERGAGREGGTPRYRMLETVRQYAQQRLDEAGEADATRARHAEHYLALAERAAPHLRGPRQIDWMAQLREEQENLVAAITWCVQEAPSPFREWGPRLTAATARYWVFNDIDLGYRLTRAALQRDDGAADSKVRWENLSGLASMCMHRGDGEEGAAHARAALEVAQRLGVPEWQAMAMNGLATCLDRSGAEEEALRHFMMARDLARASGDATTLSYILNNVAGVEFGQGKLESAEQGFRQALHLARGRGDILGTLITLHNLVRVLVAAGKHDDARARAVEAEALLRGMGDSVMRLELLEVVAGLASSRGEHPIAARFWGASRSRFNDAGYARPTVDQLQLERLSALTRQALGDASFESGEAEGRALDLDAAMRELRQWLHGSKPRV